MRTSTKLIIGSLIGAVLGYTYYYFFGCKNGCPLSSNWIVMTIYGAISGVLISYPSKKNAKKAE